MVHKGVKHLVLAKTKALFSSRKNRPIHVLFNSLENEDMYYICGDHVMDVANKLELNQLLSRKRSDLLTHKWKATL